MLVSSSGDASSRRSSRPRTSRPGSSRPVSEPWMTNRSLACDDAHVAGDHVAGGELDDVAGHELRDRRSPARAPSRTHRRRHRDHGLELRGGAVGPGLLDELQPDAQGDHGQHHDARARVAGRERDRREHRQQDHQRVEHARARAASRSPGPLVPGQHVGAVLGQARRRLVGGQPLGARLEPRVDARRIERRRLDDQRRDVDRLLVVPCGGRQLLR